MEQSNEVLTEAGLQIKQIEKRRRRIQRLKAILTVIICVLLVFPNITCIFLLIQNYQLNQQLSELNVLLSTERVRVEAPQVSFAADESLESVTDVTPEEMHYIIPDSEMYPDKQRVYLTFDDGPSKYTNDILDILAEYDVKATFFVLAKDGFDAEYKRMADEGHTLALHSYTHKYSTIYSTPAAFREDIRQISDYIYRITGQRSEFYRFPGGSSNSLVDFDKEELFTVLREEELSYFDWNVTSQDAGTVKLSAERIKQNVLDGVAGKNCSVVLMHDAADKHTTVEALPLILDALKREGNYEILPIGEGTEPVRHVISIYEEE